MISLIENISIYIFLQAGPGWITLINNYFFSK